MERRRRVARVGKPASGEAAPGGGSCVPRRPNNAVPTRTFVASSAIASSNSSLMPIDRGRSRRTPRAVRRTVRACGGARRGDAPDRRMVRGSPSACAGAPRRRFAARAERRPPCSPACPDSAPALTWIHIHGVARTARWRDGGSTSLPRSRLRSQSKCRAASRALFDCSGPIRCHSIAPPAKPEAAGAVSPAPPARGSRRRRAGRGGAARARPGPGGREQARRRAAADDPCGRGDARGSASREDPLQ